MRPKQLTRFLVEYAIPNRQSVMIIGQPGGGKSDMVDEAIMLTESDGLTSHPANEEPVDSKGYPTKVENTAGDLYATWLPFDNLACVCDSSRTKGLVWHLEDFGLATPAVQGAYMQICQRRAIGMHRLNPNVTIIGTTNDITHQAGAHAILETIKSRFTLINLEFSLDDWCDWAMEHAMPSWLIAWVRSEPDTAFPDWKPTKELKNSPCPRNVAKIGEWFNLGCRIEEVWAGRIGIAAANRAWRYLELCERAPDPKAILADPVKHPLPEEGSMTFAVVTALAATITPDQFGAGLTFASRLSKPFEVLYIQDARRRNKGKLDANPDFRRWACRKENQEICGVS